MREATERFRGRAENHAKYRPDGVLQLFRALIAPPGTVADIGSGTGILTLQLLNSGYESYAVEPNEAMRGQADAAEQCS